MLPKIRLDTRKPHKYEAANSRGRCIVCAYKKKHWLEDKKGAEWCAKKAKNAKKLSKLCSSGKAKSCENTCDNCPVSPPPAPPQHNYHLVHEGLCTSSRGLEVINTAEECEAAAIALGLPKLSYGIVTHPTTASSYPAGCASFSGRPYLFTAATGSCSNPRAPCVCKEISIPTPMPSPTPMPTPLWTPMPMPSPTSQHGPCAPSW